MVAQAIYHYTGRDAFAKIVESGRIRASHYRDFGDKEELQLGIRLLGETIKQCVVTHDDKEYRDFLLEGVEGFAAGKLEVYVLSLTEKQDSLHHWREYARTGVAIGFCRERIRSGFVIDISRRVRGATVPNPVQPDPANRFMRCRYVSQLDLAELVSKRFFGENSYPPAFRDQQVREHDAFSACLSVSIYQKICAIKGDGFADDDEWRFVYINPDADDYPIKSENNRTFIELQFEPTNFVNEVWVGPHQESKRCKESIEDFQQRGILRCSLLASRLPLINK